jgi:hypothetical protein
MSYIQNEMAYEAAIARRIRENARIGRGARWIAVPENAALIERLLRHPCDDNCFAGKMIAAYHEWNSLSDGQARAVRAMFERIDARRAERAAADAGSQHVGTIGERVVWTLNVRRVVSFETMYGTKHVHITNDDAGNVIVYAGTKRIADSGDRVTLKATIKAHGERDGVKQTSIARPKMA